MENRAALCELAGVVSEVYIGKGHHGVPQAAEAACRICAGLWPTESMARPQRSERYLDGQLP